MEATVYLQTKLNAEFWLKMHIAVTVDELVAVLKLYRECIEMFCNARPYCNKRNALK